jgi:phospholipid/cholesterol/gamma-HCH transport system substrate-binding protein
VPRHLRWSELTAGLIALGVIVAITLVVLLFARVGALHGKKVTLYVVTDEAEGVLAGTEVWLAGQKQGLVKEISFRPPTTDTSERLLITTEFLEEALPNVRRDSYAQIRPGGRLIGTPVVYISPGTSASPPLREGDTIRTRHAGVIKGVMQEIEAMVPEFNAVGAATKELAAKVRRPVGTIGNIYSEGLPDLGDIGAGISSLNARAQGGGTFGRFTRGNLQARASHAIAAADSIKTLMSSKRGSIGRFRRDSTLATKARHVLAELDTLRALLTNPVGTIASVHSDSLLQNQLDRSRESLAALMRDVKTHPLRYIRF